MRLFTEQELKLIGLGVAAATIIALVITIIVSIPRNRTKSAPSSPVVTTETRFELGVTDLAVPEDLREITFSEWHLYRPRLERWNVEQIERFWVDPEIIQLERLKEENDAKIRELFDRVP